MPKISEYRIVLADQPAYAERYAATVLREKIAVVCGVVLPIVHESEGKQDCEFVVGKTTRETECGLEIVRDRALMFEFLIRTVGNRIFFLGLGTPDPVQRPFVNNHAAYDDGAMGTQYAVYRFIDDVLEYDFLNAPYHRDLVVQKGDMEVPADYSVDYVKAALSAIVPKQIEGASMHVLACSCLPGWQQCSIVFKTREGKIIVCDGGQMGNTEYFLKSLQLLSGKEKPVVDTWFFSHMHGDHFGVLWQILKYPELRERIEIKDFYLNFIDRDFYTTDSMDACEMHGEVYDLFMDIENLMKGTRLHIVQEGDVFSCDEFSFEVIHVPNVAYRKDMDMNDSSVVYRMTYHYDGGEQSMIFLGDAEWVCSNDLVERFPHKLKSDIVQVSHHGCGGVSEECYCLIDADIAIWQCSNRFHYSDGGEGLGVRNIGLTKSRLYINESGVLPQNQYRDTNGTLSFPLPVPVR